MSAITDRLSIIANGGMKSGIPVHVINMMQQSRETVQMANDSKSQMVTESSISFPFLSQNLLQELLLSSR